MGPVRDKLLLTSLLLSSILLLDSYFSTKNLPTNKPSSDNLSRYNSKLRVKKPRVLPQTPDPALSAPINSDRRLIILLTSLRGGSTFLGKIFDENPAVQYLFEPLHGGHLSWMSNSTRLAGCTQQHAPRDRAMLYFKQILECGEVFPNWIGYIERYRLCGSEDENSRRFEGGECPLNSQVGRDDDRIRLMTAVCESRDTTVVKVIRLSSLRDLLLIRGIQNADVRVVHFIRHPIAIMNARCGWARFDGSRNPFRVNENYSTQESETILAWEAQVYCSNALETIRLLDEVPWMRDRYLRVTHTELSLNPVKTSSTIYKHAGLNMPEYIKDLIRDSTTGRAEDSMKNSTYHGDAYFITSKDSASIISKWKKTDKLPIPGIRTVDNVCSRLMTVLGETPPFDTLDLDEQLNIYTPPNDETFPYL